MKKYQLGLLIFSLCLATACSDSCPLMKSADTSAATAAPASGEAKLVSLKVDGMTCPSGCYPSVRSAIAKQKGVVDVELAPQKESDVIDNPVVFVKNQGNLDVEATLKAIERAGFSAEAMPSK